MTDCVVDSSVLLAYLNQEPSDIDLEVILFGASMGVVNFAEVIGKLVDQGREFDEAQEIIAIFKLILHPADTGLAIRAATLRPQTRSSGLSLGDRFCLALAERLGKPVLTADRAWVGLDLPIEVRLIR